MGLREYEPTYVSTSAPPFASTGRLWFDTSTLRMNVCTVSAPDVNGFSVCTTWVPLAPASVPGSIILITSGTCPPGTIEATELNGVMLRGTLAANGNVGTTGGSDTITPTVASLTAAAQTFTGSAGTVPAQTFTGSSATTSAVSAGTPAGTNNAPALTMNSYTPAGTIASSSQTKFTTNSSGTLANTTAARTFVGTAATLTGSVAAPTFTGSALATHTHTLTATGTNGTVSFTPAGTNASSAVTGTLNSFDNRPAYLNVIFCKAQ